MTSQVRIEITAQNGARSLRLLTLDDQHGSFLHQLANRILEGSPWMVVSKPPDWTDNWKDVDPCPESAKSTSAS